MHSKISRVITIKVISPPNQQRRDKELGTTIAKQNNLINQKEGEGNTQEKWINNMIEKNPYILVIRKEGRKETVIQKLPECIF